MRPAVVAMALLAGSGAAIAGDCPVDRISAALAAPLDSMKPLERDASNAQSTEGGQWRIYREADGRVNTILRIDYGETGRNELRLSIVNRRTYGIANTRFEYSHHIFEEKPNPLARATTNYYYFCDGTLWPPDSGAPSKDGIAARASILDDKDVADFTKGLAR